MTSIALQVRELQTLSPAQLAVRYEELFGKPPRTRNKAFLQRHVAWKLQEVALGGLSDRARTRLDELVANIDLPLGSTPPPKPRPQPSRDAPRAPMVGTTLVREWHGETLRVEVRENGFEWNGTLFTSLSACAKAITGSGWSGNLFFGLKRRTGA